MKRVLAAAAACLFSVHGLADDEHDKVFQISTTLYQYSSTAETEKHGSHSETVTSTELSMPNDLELAINCSKSMRIYLYPLVKNPEGMFGVGYSVMPNLEVGVRLGYVATTVDHPKASNSTLGFGVFGEYAIHMGANELELGLAVSTGSFSTKDDSTTPVTKVSGSGTAVEFDVGFAHPLCETVSYVASIGYEMASSKVKELHLTQDEQKVIVNLAGLRMHF